MKYYVCVYCEHLSFEHDNYEGTMICTVQNSYVPEGCGCQVDANIGWLREEETQQPASLDKNPSTSQ